VIRKEAWPFYRTISGVRLCWEIEERKGPKGQIDGQPIDGQIDGQRMCSAPAKPACFGALVLYLHSHRLFLAPHLALMVKLMVNPN